MHTSHRLSAQGSPPSPSAWLAALIVSAALFATPAAAHTPPRAELPVIAAQIDTGATAPAAAPALDPEAAVMVEGVKALIAAGKAGKWLLLVLALLKVVIAGLRLVAKKLPPSKFTAALTSKWGGWALNFAGSQLGAFAAAAVTGSLSMDTAIALVTVGITTSLAAAGARELVNDVKPAQAAGLAAAANPGPTLGA